MAGANYPRDPRRKPPCSPQSFRKVASALKDGLAPNKARADGLAAFATTAVEAKSIRLDDVAKRLPGAAKGKSKRHRPQDFFRELRPGYNAAALMAMGFAARLANQPPALALDRTGWKTHGGHEYNLLVLSACLGDMGLPIPWRGLHRLGNSATRKRKRLLRRFPRPFGGGRVRCLVGDREFNGREWSAWLREERVPFLMRPRQDNQVAKAGGRPAPAKNLFRGLRVSAMMDLGRRRAFATTMGVCAPRLRSGGLWVLGHHEGLAGASALALCRQRWDIEVGFEKFKAHGFNPASSRLRGGGKIERVLAALSLAAAWSYAGGRWSVRALGAARLKKHGRPEHGAFRRGLELLGGFFHGIAPDPRRTGQAAFGLLRSAAKATG